MVGFVQTSENAGLSARVGACLVAMAVAGGVYPAQDHTEIVPIFVLNEWQLPSGAADESFLAGPASVAISDSGEIYVLDTQNHRVAVFSGDGSFARSFGRAGQGPGEFVFLKNYFHSDIAVSNGRVAVLDPVQRRASVFTEQGQLLGTYSSADNASGIALDAERMYLRVHAPPTAHGPTQVAVSLEDFRGSSYGSTFMFLPSDRRSTFLNAGVIAVSGDGTLMDALTRLPLVMRYESGMLADQHVFAKEFWPDDLGLVLDEVYPLLTSFVEDGLTPPPTWRSRMLVLDLEFNKSDHDWVALVSGNFVRRFEADGAVGRAYRLMFGEEPTVDPYFFTDIGISPDGELLCAADPVILSVVACYELDS